MDAARAESIRRVAGTVKAGNCTAEEAARDGGVTLDEIRNYNNFGEGWLEPLTPGANRSESREKGNLEKKKPK